jgi:hypothetical protein
VLVVVGLGVGAVGCGSGAPATHSPRSSSASADHEAQAQVREALAQAESNYIDFHSYDTVTPQTLGNLDPRLRGVSTLAAQGNGQMFSVSVRSASGTTFEIDGAGTRLNYVCRPAGAACPGGHWSNSGSFSAAVAKLTPVQTDQVKSILLGNVNHYAALLTQGEQILGTTPYPDANAGLTAMSDPTSAASRFRDYRKDPNPESDHSYLDAFKKADAFYNAANEARSIGTWRDDMGRATSDLTKWVQDAATWQVSEIPTSQLQADAARVTSDLQTARNDVTRVARGQ